MSGDDGAAVDADAAVELDAIADECATRHASLYFAGLQASKAGNDVAREAAFESLVRDVDALLRGNGSAPPLRLAFYKLLASASTAENAFAAPPAFLLDLIEEVEAQHDALDEAADAAKDEEEETQKE